MPPPTGNSAAAVRSTRMSYSGISFPVPRPKRTRCELTVQARRMIALPRRLRTVTWTSTCAHDPQRYPVTERNRSPQKEDRKNVREQCHQEHHRNWHVKVQPRIHHCLIADVAPYPGQQQPFFLEQNPNAPPCLLDFGWDVDPFGIEIGDRRRSGTAREVTGQLPP